MNFEIRWLCRLTCVPQKETFHFLTPQDPQMCFYLETGFWKYSQDEITVSEGGH